MRQHDGGVGGAAGFVSKKPLRPFRAPPRRAGRRRKEPGLKILLDIIPMIGDMHSVSSPRGSGHDGDLGGRR